MSDARYNLPAQLIPLVGREKEIGELLSLLEDPQVRLITLQGLGGTGKTRLAVETGQAAGELFPDGVWFVALAGLSSAEHITTATAAAMGYSFLSHEDQEGQLFRYLEGKRLLLIFDNLEHLLPEGSAHLERLLQNVADARLLVTSRQPIDAPWEWVYPLIGLVYEADPSLQSGAPPAAVELFSEQFERVAGPAAGIDPACAAQVCQIVRGLPLALLLAASWGRTLGCDEIVEELQRGVGFLQTQQMSFPEKHSSMQAVFDYSWQRLSEGDQAALRKLSVFQGGLDREAAAEVAGAQLPRLARLVDQSLVERVSKDRYQIHELLRQYLNERLEEAGEAESTGDRHLSYYTHLAEQAEPGLMGKEQKVWLARLKSEIDNIRAALEWSLSHGEAVHLEHGLRLMAWSARFWYQHTYAAEGRGIVVRLLGAEPPGSSSPPYTYARARGYNLASSLSFWLEDFPKAKRFADAALQIGNEINDSRIIGDAFYNLGQEASFGDAFYNPEQEASLWRDTKPARSWHKQALESYEKAGFLPGTTDALIALGQSESFDGDFSEAFAHLSRALEIAKERGDNLSNCLALWCLGQLALLDPRIGAERARAYAEEALKYAREVDDKRTEVHIRHLIGEAARLLAEFNRAAAVLEEADALAVRAGLKMAGPVIEVSLGFVYFRLGEYGHCKRLFLDNLRLAQFREDVRLGRLSILLPFCLLGMAGVAGADGEAQWAATILGAIDGHTKEILSFVTDKRDYERILTSTKAQLTQKEFEQHYTEGQKLSLAEAAQLVLSQGTKEKGRDAERLAHLTKREIEVLRLVALGMSDAQVAERLVLSPRTVNAHLTSIYNKLGVTSRAAATRFAVEHGLA